MARLGKCVRCGAQTVTGRRGDAKKGHMCKQCFLEYQLPEITRERSKAQRLRGPRKPDARGYVYYYPNGEYGGKVLYHRFIWESHHGKIPEKWHVHHINGKKDDNRIENLCAMSMKDHASLVWIKELQRRIRTLERALLELQEAQPSLL